MNTATPLLLPPLYPVAPELVLLCTGLVLIGADLFLRQVRILQPWLTAVGALASLVLLYTSSGATSFSPMYLVDGYSVFFKAVCLAGVILTVLLSHRYLEKIELKHGEYYSLLVFAALGMMVMVSAGDLVVLYLGLELMALSVYCLVGLRKQDSRSNEAALKYFLSGAFSSGLLLFGMSVVYGLCGTTEIRLLAQRISELSLAANPALLGGLALMLAGFAFKVAAAPFHMWTPDVYEGAPTSVTAFMSVGPKAASFAILGRVLLTGFGAAHEFWAPLLGALAVATMAVGNLTALAQKSVKRMLAYSAVAHAGYALLGAVAGGTGFASSMTYLLIYTFMNIGAFGVMIFLADRHGRGEMLDDYRGLATTHPLAAALLLVFLFSLAGIPPLAGFIGKFYLLMAVIRAGYSWLALAAVSLSAVAAFYYLRVVRVMYLEPAVTAGDLPRLSPAAVLALAVSFAAVVGLGLLPGRILAWAEFSLASLL